MRLQYKSFGTRDFKSAINRLKLSPKQAATLDVMLTNSYNIIFGTKIDSVTDITLTTSQRREINNLVKTGFDIMDAETTLATYKQCFSIEYGHVLRIKMGKLQYDNRNRELTDKHQAKESKHTNAVFALPRSVRTYMRKWFDHEYRTTPEKLLAAAVFYMFDNYDKTSGTDIALIDTIKQTADYAMAKHKNAASGKNRHTEYNNEAELDFACFMNDWNNGKYKDLNYLQKIDKVKFDHKVGQPTAKKFLARARVSKNTD